MSDGCMGPVCQANGAVPVRGWLDLCNEAVVVELHYGRSTEGPSLPTAIQLEASTARALYRVLGELLRAPRVDTEEMPAVPRPQHRADVEETIHW